MPGKAKWPKAFEKRNGFAEFIQTDDKPTQSQSRSGKPSAEAKVLWNFSKDFSFWNF
jgi:hypothetical protein